MFFLTRSTGIVAMVLMVASLLWGFLFSSRATGKRLRPNWWLDLHNWLGGLALVFTGAHIAAALLDTDSGIGVLEVLVPGTATDAWAITWGVIAAYLTAVVVFTTWPRRWKNRRWWRIVHLLSVLGTALALLHSYQSGNRRDAAGLPSRHGDRRGSGHVRPGAPPLDATSGSLLGLIVPVACDIHSWLTAASSRWPNTRLADWVS